MGCWWWCWGSWTEGCCNGGGWRSLRSPVLCWSARSFGTWTEKLSDDQTHFELLWDILHEPWKGKYNETLGYWKVSDGKSLKIDTFFYSDLKLFTWILKSNSVQITAVEPGVRSCNVGDAHIHNWSAFFMFNGVSPILNSVSRCFNKNVFFFTFVFTEDHSSSNRCKGELTASCHIFALCYCENSLFCSKKTSTDTTEGWRRNKNAQLLCVLYLICNIV